MKKTLLIAALIGISGLVHATSITGTTITASGLGTLNGANAYSWGVSIPIASGQTVISAAIDFTSVQLTSTGSGTLYADLLNSQATGVKSVSDTASGDYWATKFFGANIASLGSTFFASQGTTLTWGYILNTSQLAALNSYLAVGTSHTFTIGIDPDCTYTVGGISFTYNLSPQTNGVPDAGATALMMLMGLAGLEIFRRQFMVAKVKA